LAIIFISECVIFSTKVINALQIEPYYL
jgi:hypothetical protein